MSRTARSNAFTRAWRSSVDSSGFGRKSTWWAIIRVRAARVFGPAPRAEPVAQDADRRQAWAALRTRDVLVGRSVGEGHRRAAAMLRCRIRACWSRVAARAACVQV